MSKIPPVSAVPAASTAPVKRPVSIKKLARLRLNWFVVGSVFGVGISFFMSFLLTALVLPHYREVMASHHAQPAGAAEAQEVEAAPTPAPKAKVVVAAAPVVSVVAPASAAPKIAVAETRREKLDDPSAMKELAMKLPANTSVVAQAPISKEAAQKLAAVKVELKKPTNRRYGVIKSSFFQGGASAGIPFSMMNDLVKAFSYDVDFQRDIHPGDSIEVLLNDTPATTGKGKKKTAAKVPASIRYAALTLEGKKYEIFRYNAGAGYAWYDSNGRSIKKSLLATPINAAHITSGFGMREHPVLGYTKFHRGVDFGASQGTPIMAAGDGTIEFKGWKTGYGNFVIIKHNDIYETAYGHISRFGRIAVGSRVHQGQVIAYVGMTGMATGPHLHYEVRLNGTQVNPVSRQFNMASGLSGKQLAQFKANRINISRELASAASTSRVASR